MVKSREKFISTTILSVRRDGEAAIGGDGQVTQGSMVFKYGAKKIRSLANGKVKIGFAGSTGDAIALMELFEKKLGEFHNDIVRAAIELAKEWRVERSMRRLQSSLIVVDKEKSLLLGGEGDVFESDDGVLAVGSGGGFATAAARALLAHSKLSALEIVRNALEITADLCVYTNHNLVVETVGAAPGK
ncbi:MAG: ATP-dependent protease subunit HslV [Planctomycetota bacterium]|jgi:ATP-dependent HslUV protease subunit HslV|nr:ATP-dependent protease subunit HslV [Planctomycetota bacterium]